MNDFFFIKQVNFIRIDILFFICLIDITMGNENKGTSQEQYMKKNPKDSAQNNYEEEYNRTYEQLKDHPDFFNQFLYEIPNFSKNLLKLFPNGLSSPEQYFQMVTYLRKYEPLIKLNKQAAQNAKSSTLIDRFLMICLGNLTFEEFKNTKLPKEKIEELLIDYYGLFIENPKNSLLDKAVKFINMEEEFKKEELIPVKIFSEKFRQYFPHVQKYLKDYYLAKFHAGKKHFRILHHFKSKILNQDAIILALKVPEVAKPEVVQLYNSENFGIGFHAIEKKLVGYTGPWLMLIEHIEKENEGQKGRYVFGTYQNGPVKNINVYQGDLTGFLFSIEPNIRFMTTDRGDGAKNYFLINSADQKFTKRRKGIGFGGNNQMQNFKLWIDEDMDKSKVYNGNDPTYGYGALAGAGTSTLSIKRMQIWALGTNENLQDQKNYWQQRHAEIMKRRKVDKTQFFDDSAGLFFEKTLQHRDQVVGEIEKGKHQEQKK